MIGEYKEKTLHSVLKNRYEPTRDKQEVPYLGYICDIKNEQGITEIQTNALYRLRPKLKAFLEQDKVTVVYPIIEKKTVIRMNRETGEILSRRLSNKRGCLSSVFAQLYSIKMFLKEPNLTIRIVMLNADEYSILKRCRSDGRREYEKSETIPTEILREIDITSPQDYYQFLPDELPCEFTVSDYKRTISRFPKNAASCAINVLCFMGVIENIGKRGREKLYKKNQK